MKPNKDLKNKIRKGDQIRKLCSTFQVGQAIALVTDERQRQIEVEHSRLWLELDEAIRWHKQEKEFWEEELRTNESLKNENNRWSCAQYEHVCLLALSRHEERLIALTGRINQ